MGEVKLMPLKIDNQTCTYIRSAVNVSQITRVLLSSPSATVTASFPPAHASQGLGELSFGGLVGVIVGIVVGVFLIFGLAVRRRNMRRTATMMP